MYEQRDLKPNRGFFGKGESKKERIVRSTGTDTESFALKPKKVVVVN